MKEGIKTRRAVELIKRYQIIYKEGYDNKDFYLTSPHEKWTIEEFKQKFHNIGWTYERWFHAIIPESEEEFDE